MKTYSRLTLAFLLLILVVPPVRAEKTFRSSNTHAKPPATGPYILYFDKSMRKKFMEGRYENGKREGRQTSWDYDGRKKKEGYWKDGKEHGLWTFWAGKKKKVERNFKNGLQDGVEIKYNTKTGRKKSETNWKGGKKHGPIFYWWENGQKSSVSHYKDGEKDGLSTGWYSDGQKSSEHNYKNGKLDGHQVKYRQKNYRNGNGRKTMEAHWKNGNATSTSFYPNGQTRLVIRYEAFKPVSASSWWPSGEKCPRTNLINGTGDIVEYQTYFSTEEEHFNHYFDKKTGELIDRDYSGVQPNVTLRRSYLNGVWVQFGG